MRQLSAAGLEAIEGLSRKHGFSPEAVLSMLDSVILGNSQMAQFNHPEFGGGQWMRGGMIMISDMFNNALKGRIDGLCTDLAALVASQPDLVQTGNFQSQSQGRSGDVSLFVAGGGNWWGAELGRAASTGAQNNVRYAWFPQSRRLAIEVNGQVTIYDTLEHQIGGFSQQQSHGSSLTFTSQHGLIDVAGLPVVSAGGVQADPPAAAPQNREDTSFRTEPSRGAEPTARVETAEAPPPSSGTLDIFATLEKLAALHANGILTAEEFAAKKTELLSRL